MSSVFFSILMFFVAFGILVIVHEFGHYLVARWVGVKILRFSIGFGPVIARFKSGKDQTEWALSVLPLGGYVQMADTRNAPTNEENRAFDKQSVGKRILIAAAGPTANFLFAIFAYWIIGIIGFQGVVARLGVPPAETPAAIAGFQTGDKILQVGDTRIQTWQDFSSSVIHHVFAQDNTIITVEREKTAKTISLDLTKFTFPSNETDLLDRVGFTLFKPHIPAVIGQVTKGSPAEAAGLKPLDQVIAFDGKPVEDWGDFVKNISEKADKPTPIEVERDNKRFNLTITPKSDPNDSKKIGKIGVQLKVDPAIIESIFQPVRFNPIDAVPYAWNSVIKDLTLTFQSLGQLITGNLSISNLSGPISIAGYANEAASQGIVAFLNFLGFLSINLCILNLLPIPVLDGGHLLYYLVEAIRGKPLSERTQQIGQIIGFVLLVLLMVLVSYNDIIRQ